MPRLLLALLTSFSLIGSLTADAATCGTVNFDLPREWPAFVGSVLADFNQDGLMDVATMGTANGGNHALTLLLASRTMELVAAQPIAEVFESAALFPGDFDGDGRPDLIITSIAGVKRQLFLFRGDGRGGLTKTFNTEVSNAQLFVGDFDGDGRGDLLDAVNGVIFHGRSDGTMSSTTVAPMDIGLRTGLVADFDGDGKSDLVYPSPSKGIVIVTAASGMTSRIVVAGFFSVTGLEVADVNGDGRPDVLFTDNSAGLNVALNHGGTFNGWIHSNSWVNDRSALADVDGDSFADLLLTVAGEGLYLHGNGDGTFTPTQRFATNTYGVYGGGVIGVADFDGNGTPDLAVVGDTGLMIIPTLGNGVIGGPTLLSMNEFSKAYGYVFAAIDVNGDHRPDLISTNAVSREVVTWLNMPGGFTQVRSDNVILGSAGQSGDPTKVVFAYGDLNGDGTIDLVTTKPGNSPADGSRLLLLLGDGQGRFAEAALPYPLGTNPTEAFVTDVDGDGSNDVVLFGPTQDSNDQRYALQIVRANAGGALQPPITALVTQRGQNFVTAGDFNGDGRLDFIFYSFQGTVIVFNDGHGGYPVQTPIAPMSGVVADLNGDGKDDIISNGIEYSNGDGTFRTGPTVGYGARLAADMDGDGRLDVIGEDDNKYVFIQLNRGDAFTPRMYLGQRAVTLVAADLDLDGRTDLVIGDTGALLRNICVAANSGPRRRPTTNK